ncbi:alpha/beta hydrolase [Aeromicrobium sp.]|uniref:alpha/beta hydrolase family protein n=1 Tax=Aeromicrobium sp. TaxID=1871063 RepID=UPI0025C5117B|nr:alpha/beta hydrolase [Aeromicrobium sp.]
MAATTLAACSPAPKTDSRRKRVPVQKIRYGTDASQFGELSRPTGASKGVVVVIHGGFWRAEYDLSLGRPLAASLVDNGWTAWNLEYRRVGNGGGWPGTFDDIAAGIDTLSTVDKLDTSKVVTLGHSAGGHLAVWAAGRSRLATAAWNKPAVPVTAAISQAGVIELRKALEADLGGGAVQALMGSTVGKRYQEADPLAQIPLDVPVRCVHGTSDDTVPISQSIGYVEKAKSAGADAELVEVEGDHFVVIDPSTRAWARTLEILEAW